MDLHDSLAHLSPGGSRKREIFFPKHRTGRKCRRASEKLSRFIGTRLAMMHYFHPPPGERLNAVHRGCGFKTQVGLISLFGHVK